MGCQTHANFQLVVVTGSLEEKKRNSVHSLFKNFSIFSIFVDFVLQPTDFLLETRFALPHPSLHDSTQYIELWRDGCSAMSWRGLAVLLNMTATFAYAYGPERQVFHFLGASTIQNGTKVPLFSKRISPPIVGVLAQGTTTVCEENCFIKHSISCYTVWSSRILHIRLWCKQCHILFALHFSIPTH